MDEGHYRGLERLYAAAPCNQGLGLELQIEERRARVRLPFAPSLCHALGAVHGSYYFKLLDDAAFFAANSLVSDVFVLTASFNVNLMAPITDGEMVSEGTVIRAGKTLIFAESRLTDGAGRLLATGSGTFARSRALLAKLPGYIRD